MSKKGGTKNYSPNEMRSIAMNPNNIAHSASIVNRGNQLNQNHSSYLPKSEVSNKTNESNSGEIKH